MVSFRKFLSDETGAVTVDWVVLTSGAAVLAVIVVPPIQSSIVNMAIYISDSLFAAESFE